MHCVSKPQRSGLEREAPLAKPVSQSLKAPRLSIVVLPFTNLSIDPEQQYFSDGVTEDLTTDLSRLKNMFVISRNTAFTYRDKPIDTKQIGRELGVRYVLEGSVRRSGSQLRVNVQLAKGCALDIPCMSARAGGRDRGLCYRLGIAGAGNERLL